MKNRLGDFIRGSAPVKALVRFIQRIHPPGFEGLSLYEVSRFFFIGINRGELQARTASMAYSFFIALFPMLIFLFTLIPYIPVHDFQATVLETVRQILPKSSFDEMKDTITEIISKHNSKLLSIGFIAALYFSTNGFSAMMSAFNKSIHIMEKRPWWKQRLLALILVIVFTVLLVAAITLIVESQVAFAHMFHRGLLRRIFIEVIRWMVIGFLIMLVIGLYYRVGPAKRMHRNFFSPGVYLATALIILTSVIFTYYVNHFGRYNKLYGSIGSVIAVLVGIYFNSMMLLIGFELDAGISIARQNKTSVVEEEKKVQKKEEKTG